MNKDNAIKQLKGLKQYKNKTDEELLVIAQEQLQKSEIIDNLSFCLNDEEKKFAMKLLEKYLSIGSLENESDKMTLKLLIDMEVLAERIKSFLNTEYSKANPALPTQMLEQLRETNDQIVDLKEKLGLTKANKEDATWQKDWSDLRKKALKYLETHKGCNLVKCPNCQSMFYLLMRTEHLSPEKCNWFRGTMLYNKDLFKMYHEKRISEEEITRVLGVSKYYIDFIYNNLYLKEEKQ